MADKKLTPAEIEARLAKLSGWTLKDGVIRRQWKTKGFKATVMAANAVAHLAELAFHHPEMILNFGSLEVRLSTHDAGGITEKDFALAAKIDALLDWRPGTEGGPLEGPGPKETAGAYFAD